MDNYFGNLHLFIDRIKMYMYLIQEYKDTSI